MLMQTKHNVFSLRWKIMFMITKTVSISFFPMRKIMILNKFFACIFRCLYWHFQCWPYFFENVWVTSFWSLSTVQIILSMEAGSFTSQFPPLFCIKSLSLIPSSPADHGLYSHLSGSHRSSSANISLPNSFIHPQLQHTFPRNHGALLMGNI